MVSKQYMSKGWSACGVWEGRVTMSNLNAWAYSIDSKMTWELCPSKINRWQLILKVMPEIVYLKKARNSLNNKQIIQVSSMMPCMSPICDCQCNYPTIILFWKWKTLVLLPLLHSFHNRQLNNLEICEWCYKL